jgi:imidazoleglycerol-phosphate dehydratase/histidinol-phosphatase
MPDIFIDRNFLDTGNRYAKGIISGLKKLQLNGYGFAAADIKTLPKCISEVLRLEGIDIAEYSTDKRYDAALLLSGNADAHTVLQVPSADIESFQEAVNALLRRKRSAELRRTTKETDIYVHTSLDGTGKAEINTGIGFFDHMLEQIARHGNIDLTINVKGDLHIDEHHTVEDTGITLGEVLCSALGDKKGIKRYGFLLPMDEAESKVSIDLGGRFYLQWNADFKRERVGDFPAELTEEFFRALASGLKATLHIESKGKNDHHKIESIFKGFAKAFNEACRFDERAAGTLPTTKGVL